jgi:hypothetical protein
MSNEVEIVIKDRDATGPGAASARHRADRLGKDVEKSLTDSGDKAGKGFSKKLVDGVDKGGKESVKKLTGSFGSIDEQLKKTQKEISVLARQFSETGDIDVLKKLRDARSVFANLKQVKKELQDVGEDGGKNLVNGMDKSVKDGSPGLMATLKKPLIMGGAAIGVALGIKIISGASSAITAGSAAGALGLGALILSQDADVKKAASSLMMSVKSTLLDAAEPLKGPFLDALSQLGDSVTGLKPQLKGLFADAAPSVGKFVDGLTGFTKGALPGFRDMVEESGPAVDSLSNSMVLLGHDTGTALSILADGSEESAKALGDVVGALGDIIIVTAGTIKGITKINAALSDTGNLSGWKKSLADIANPKHANGIWVIGKAISWTSDKLGGDYALSASSAADQSKTLTRQLRHTSDAMDKLSAATREFNDLAVGAADAEIGLYNAIASGSKTIKHNGKELSLNTEKGRENRQALVDIAGAALDASGAIVDMGGSTDSATRKLNKGYTALVKAAEAAGMSKTAADKLARSYGLLPAAKVTKVKASGAKGAKHDVDALKRSVDRLHGKDVFITTHMVTTGGGAGARIGQQVKASGGIVGAAASGGARAGRVLVGEHEPEVVDLPAGSRVHSGPDSRRLLAEGDSGPVKVELTIRGDDTRTGRFIAEILRNVVRVDGGGNVQVALGNRNAA